MNELPSPSSRTSREMFTNEVKIASLPAAAARPLMRNLFAVKPAATQPYQILVASAAEACAQSILALEQLGSDVEWATNGEAVLERQAGQRFDLIVYGPQHGDPDPIATILSIRRADRIAGRYTPIAALFESGESPSSDWANGNARDTRELFDHRAELPLDGAGWRPVLESLAEHRQDAAVPVIAAPDDVWERLGGDPAFLAEIAAMLRADVQRLLPLIRQATEADDPAAAARAAHELAGAASNVGGDQVSAAALGIEAALLTPDRPGFAAAWVRLLRAVERLLIALAAWVADTGDESIR